MMKQFLCLGVLLTISFEAQARVEKGVYKGFDSDNKECILEVLNVTLADENIINQTILVKNSFNKDLNLTLRVRLNISSNNHTISYQRSFFEGAKSVDGALYAAAWDVSKNEFKFYQNVELIDHRVQTQSICSSMELQAQ